ncbi:MAG: WcaI family glycosyltransferase [Syntrophomonas sp.]
MNLLIYGLNYAPEPTGTGKYTGEMAEWLAQRGHEVDAIVAPPYYPEWRIGDEYKDKGFFEEMINGVHIYRSPLYVPAADNISAGTRIRLESSFSFNSLRWGIPRFFSQKYDAVIAVCPPLQAGVYPWLYSRLRGVPWVFHIQDLQVDAAIRLDMLKSGLAGKVLYKIENSLLNLATRVSTITEAMRQRIIAKGVPDNKTWLFPNWSDIDFIRPLSRENRFRQELGLGKNAVLIMYAGNIGEKQGLELIVQAADRLRNNDKLYFLMVGAGAAKLRLEGLAKQMDLENLRFLPVQPFERLPEMLAAADIHLVVQKREAADIVMPSKLTNILAAGRPCIATADPWTTLYEVVDSYETGLVCPPEELEHFTDSIKKLAEEGELRRKMGENARKYAEQWLSKDYILEDFESRLLELINQKGGEK